MERRRGIVARANLTSIARAQNDTNLRLRGRLAYHARALLAKREPEREAPYAGAMRLDSATLARMRDELRSRGARVSLPPPSGAPASQASVDVLAIMERVAPICEVLYLLMVADCDSDARELEVLRGTVRALTDGVLKTTVIEGMIARFEAALDAYGKESRLAQVTAQLSADRQDAEAAFVLASVMAIADESPNERERAVLEELREQLGISSARARSLVGETGLA